VQILNLHRETLKGGYFMKTRFVLSVLLVCVFNVSAFANTIQPAIDSFSLTGIQSTAYPPWLSSQVWGDSTFTSSLYLGLGAPSGFFSVAVASQGSLSANILRCVFSAAAGTLTGTFAGTENVWIAQQGARRMWKYDVTGTFSEQISYNRNGEVSIAIASATYTGTNNVPEPGTWLMVSTGLAGLWAAKRKHLDKAIRHVIS
jgi:PEP-CTERM motif